jgi:hypothetical protein
MNRGATIVFAATWLVPGRISDQPGAGSHRFLASPGGPSREGVSPTATSAIHLADGRRASREHSSDRGPCGLLSVGPFPPVVRALGNRNVSLAHCARPRLRRRARRGPRRAEHRTPGCPRVICVRCSRRRGAPPFEAHLHSLHKRAHCAVGVADMRSKLRLDRYSGKKH